eukprot:TRINITY_DN2816_c0_g1::TRINITY_DN2816_c0_g1_i1::g.6001::m.6001 TRINITY_DN2816_c0_g1::TRINITY_DN2816_c0_g1_i1::g.6001  ORF type:complete len:458 (-),score=149.19,sp/P93836/HPPD_ARATH/56.29/2e-159,Glyoxalase_5/PF14696.1/3.9e-06,Glyoxalase/PF00903.20/20,Glyoxalase/PF00903.20/0.009,Glyoxalase_4/PF13669.1/3.7,Glyoxalase_4/PF13669.1/0.98,Glyoxalase_4/PF13669.1/9.2e+03,Glyoxalase_3/PF13468.1/43,Glyoxalase_3/PF13468.1/5.4e+03,Glyoxalase_3/PF13468.1/5.9 TRINITY_DN2816_c0_g1_i1:233-1537(-)
MEHHENPKFQLVGAKNFVRHNPMTDRFPMHGFDHIEFYCMDATNTSKRFQWGLGMQLVAKSDQSTGNHHYASYVLQSGEIKFIFTAPYAKGIDRSGSVPPIADFDVNHAFDFCVKHGFAARSMGIEVKCAKEAYEISVANGAKPVKAPVTLNSKKGSMTISEVIIYGDVALRYISKTEDYECDHPFLPGYEKVDSPDFDYGLLRIDHCVGNTPCLSEAFDYITKFTGWHEYAEFTTEDVGTVDSGLNSVVLSNNSETILLPVNEPTFGTKRRSQIQTYLEQNEGAGLQHIALLTPDIFHTARELKKRIHIGGFEFMPPASDEYYANLPTKIGDALTAEQFKEVKELGLLVDKDDQGVLVQVFTKPLGDRPTIFIEIIQRIGCMHEHPVTKKQVQKAGCGGFGKGNFSELFKSLEEYEKNLDFKDCKKSCQIVGC